MKQREQAHLYLKKAAEDENRFRKTHDLRELIDLLTDNANPIPPNLADIDSLTPYGTLFRYDLLDAGSAFDRVEARKMVQDLHGWVEDRIRNS